MKNTSVFRNSELNKPLLVSRADLWRNGYGKIVRSKRNQGEIRIIPGPEHPVWKVLDVK